MYTFHLWNSGSVLQSSHMTWYKLNQWGFIWGQTNTALQKICEIVQAKSYKHGNQDQYCSVGQPIYCRQVWSYRPCYCYAPIKAHWQQMQLLGSMPENSGLNNNQLILNTLQEKNWSMEMVYNFNQYIDFWNFFPQNC